MFRLAQRRNGALLVGQWLNTTRTYATSLSSQIRIANHAAPHTGEITVLSLNRPKARNAISRQLLGELSAVVEQMHSGKSSARALVIASESPESFCAGADLKERLTMTPDETREFLTLLRGTLTRLSSLPIPTISAVSSTAFGGGLELALCTNFRVFASTASVGLPETRLGIVPGAGGTYRLPALIGETRARDLIFTGRRLSGPEAYFIGLCDRLVEITEEEAANPSVAQGKTLEHALEMASLICEGGPIAVKTAHQAINGWRDGQKSEDAAYDIILPTADRMEALRAFAEKRKPVFKGQ